MVAIVFTTESSVKSEPLDLSMKTAGKSSDSSQPAAGEIPKVESSETVDATAPPLPPRPTHLYNRYGPA